MKILITSIGVSGKSTFRKRLYALLSNIHNLIIFDFDLDYDRAKLPKIFEPDRIYILEDVHGPTKNAVFPLPQYDLIFYLLPDFWQHLRFWLKRMKIWFENGNYAWDADIGEKGAWAGTDKPKDWANIPGIIKYFYRHFSKRNIHLKEDLEVLNRTVIPVIIVMPTKKQGYTFTRL